MCSYFFLGLNYTYLELFLLQGVSMDQLVSVVSVEM